jgi:hypothetical protein
VQPGRILASARKLSNSAEQFVARGDQVIVFGSEWTRKVHRPSLSGRLGACIPVGQRQDCGIPRIHGRACKAFADAFAERA